jgi:hypothetical protein
MLLSVSSMSHFLLLFIQFSHPSSSSSPVHPTVPTYVEHLFTEIIHHTEQQIKDLRCTSVSYDSDSVRREAFSEDLKKRPEFQALIHELIFSLSVEPKFTKPQTFSITFNKSSLTASSAAFLNEVQKSGASKKYIESSLACSVLQARLQNSKSAISGDPNLFSLDKPKSQHPDQFTIPLETLQNSIAIKHNLNLMYDEWLPALKSRILGVNLFEHFLYQSFSVSTSSEGVKLQVNWDSVKREITKHVQFDDFLGLLEKTDSKIFPDNVHGNIETRLFWMYKISLFLETAQQQ